MNLRAGNVPMNDLITAVIRFTYHFPNEGLSSLNIVRLFNKPFELNCINMLVVLMQFLNNFCFPGIQHFELVFVCYLVDCIIV